MKPDQLLKLATALGLKAHIDDEAGYAVHPVIVETGRAGRYVFNPADNSDQAMAVLCWLMAQRVFGGIDERGIYNSIKGCLQWPHDNTPPSLRAAILAAALRVAGET